VSSNPVAAIGLQAMQADMARVQQTSMNLANALTPGYKRGMVVQAPMQSSFQQALDAAGQADAGVAAPVRFEADGRPGTLKKTGDPLDVAVAGPGFFEILTDTGPAYTRQGNFRLDARGRLVTAQGFPVAGRDGEIFLPTRDVSISEAGAISDPAKPGTVLAQLKVVDFPSEGLVRRGDGLLAAAEGMTLLADDQVRLRQGFVENANVDAAREMTQLMVAMRHFESMHKAVQVHDDMLGTAIRRLGESS
jgi:flagellar basal-body rod protein FlgG